MTASISLLTFLFFKRYGKDTIIGRPRCNQNVFLEEENNYFGNCRNCDQKTIYFIVLIYKKINFCNKNLVTIAAHDIRVIHLIQLILNIQSHKHYKDLFTNFCTN